MDKHIVAMKLIVEWRRMKDLCKERSTCVECPYYYKKQCEMISTDAMIDKCADIFEKHLIERG